VGTIVGSIRYRPTPIPSNPKHQASDVTVVIPTTEILSETFRDVVHSILRHPVHKLIIATAGTEAMEQEEAVKAMIEDSRILIVHREHANRREQTAQAMAYVETELIILQDNHTYWPARECFIQSIIAPFEDESVGGVAPVLEARHRKHPIGWAGFWNFLGMTYLARRKFEYRGTFGIDGGISTLSGRFGVFRTSIYGSEEFLHAYLNEYFNYGFGKVGPLNADDDKFHTRWLIEKGYKIKLQAGPESTIMTELGEWPKFNEQVLRWMRTTWRSNPRQLLTSYNSWLHHPYTTLTLLLWFARFSLLQEAFMFGFLYKALEDKDEPSYFKLAAPALFVWIVAIKYVKVAAHFRRHPEDILYFPAYLLFGLWATLVKVFAVLTLWNTSWATAKISDEKDEAKEHEDAEATSTALQAAEDVEKSSLTRSGRVAMCFCTPRMV
jgi:hypothetical protein